MHDLLQRPSFGMVLDHFEKPDRNTTRPAGWFVASRLLGSPAALAGITGRYREQLLCIGNEPVGTQHDLVLMLQAAYACESTHMQLRVWTTGETIRAVLTPYYLWRWTKIPVHPLRHGHHREDYETGDVTRGMTYCQRTGYLVPTSRLTEVGLRRIFHS